MTFLQFSCREPTKKQKCTSRCLFPEAVEILIFAVLVLITLVVTPVTWGLAFQCPLSLPVFILP